MTYALVALFAFALGALATAKIVQRGANRIAAAQRNMDKVQAAATQRVIKDAERLASERTAREIARRIGDIHTLDEIAGAKVGLPDYNPLWDAARLIEREFLAGERG